jgi:multidrug efflux pump subunit AcrA (membrane-fusion protein)
MSKLGKIFLYIAVAGALADIVGAILSYNKFGTDKSNIALAKQNLAAEKSQVDSANKAAKEALDARNTAQGELSDANAKIDGLQTQLVSAQKDLTDAQVALKKATEDAQVAEQQLQTLQGKYDTQNEAYKKAAADLLASQDEQQLLQTQVNDSVAQISELKNDLLNMNHSYIPPGVSGKVTFVNHAWNFVVLNVGLSNGVVPNGQLIVYRGRDFLGRVKVTSAETSSCVADIMPDAKADIQVGDDVLN